MRPSLVEGGGEEGSQAAICTCQVPFTEQLLAACSAQSRAQPSLHLLPRRRYHTLPPLILRRQLRLSTAVCGRKLRLPFTVLVLDFVCVCFFFLDKRAFGASLVPVLLLASLHDINPPLPPPPPPLPPLGDGWSLKSCQMPLMLAASPWSAPAVTQQQEPRRNYPPHTHTPLPNPLLILLPPLLSPPPPPPPLGFAALPCC